MYLIVNLYNQIKMASTITTDIQKNKGVSAYNA